MEKLAKKESDDRPIQILEKFDIGSVRISLFSMREFQRLSEYASKNLRETHPELFTALSSKAFSHIFGTVGTIDIDLGAVKSRNLLQEGSTPTKAILELKKDVVHALEALASAVVFGESRALRKLQYLVGVSRLAGNEQLARKFGFEVFEPDPENKYEKYHYSTDLAQRVYEEELGMSVSKASALVRRSGVKIAVMSRNTLTRLYATDRDHKRPA